MDNVRIGPLELILLLVLAIGLSVGMTVGQSDLLIGLVAVTMLLIAAFLSTQVALYLLVFSMLLSPEVMVGGLGPAAKGAASTAGRGVTLRFDDVLLVVFGFVWLVKAALHKEEAPLKGTPLNGPIIWYVVASLVATIVGMLVGRVKPLTGLFFNLKYIEYVFLYFMVVNAVTDRRQASRLVMASLIVCFLVSLYAMAQIPQGQRASAPFEGETGEPNTLGGYLVFMLSIVGGLLLTPEAVRRKWPLLILLFVGVLALLSTLSRSSMLAGAIIIFIIMAKYSYRKPLLLTLLLVVLAASPWWAPDTVKKRILFTFTQKAEQGQVRVGGLRVDTSTSARLASWEEAWRLFQESPLVGKGVTGGPFMDAMYPRVMVETGLLGMVAFLVLLWGIVRVGLACYRDTQDPSVRGLALGFLLGFVGLLVHAVGSNTFIIVRIMEPFWLFAALLVRHLLGMSLGQPAEAEAWAGSVVEARKTGLAGTAASPAPGSVRFGKS